MDLGSMPMQTDPAGLPNELTPESGQQARTNAFSQNVFMGVSDLSPQQQG